MRAVLYFILAVISSVMGLCGAPITSNEWLLFAVVFTGLFACTVEKR